MTRETRNTPISTTSADFAWWRDWRPEWAQAYCVTLMSDTTVERVLTSLRATKIDVAHGFDAFHARAVEAYDPVETLVGLIGVEDGWVVMAEVNGFIGVTERLIGPLSPGRTIVSHFRNVNAVYRFHWWLDGALLIDIDLLFPHDRFGADPDKLLADIDDVGVSLNNPDGEPADVDHDAAGFALIQRITGVSCTAALFEHGEFTTGCVATPSPEDELRYRHALHQTWRNPTVW